MSGQKRRKRDFFVHFFSDDADTFAHGKGGEDGADAQSFDVTEAEKCHAGGDGQADNVKGDFWIYRCAESACPVFWKSPVRTEEITVPDR